MPAFGAILLYCSLFVSLFFEIFLLITYLEVRGQIKKEDEMVKIPRSVFPSVTIIVPSFNEEKTLAATVKSLLKLDYPKDKLSLVLVDDGSTDDTLLMMNKFKTHPQISILSKINGGKHTAVNLALENINTDLVGCLDADSFVNPDVLKKIIPYFDNAETMAVTPSIKVHEPKNVLQYIQKTEYTWSIFLRRMLSSLGALYVTPGPFSIFRTQVFRELGGYRRAHMTEDMEMAMRLQKNHYKIVNSHGAHVYTVTPETLPSLVKQRTRWTYGFINNALDYKELFFNRKYGNIGMFIFPVAFFSIFSSLILVSRIGWNVLKTSYKFVERYQAVGFTHNFSFPSFDWYFINTGVLSIIVALALVMTVVILYFSFVLADGKFKFHRGILYYMFLYVFMTPLWVLRALFNTVFRRETSWR